MDALENLGTGVRERIEPANPSAADGVSIESAACIGAAWQPVELEIGSSPAP
jgi:hypothetical protein